MTSTPPHVCVAIYIWLMQNYGILTSLLEALSERGHVTRVISYVLWFEHLIRLGCRGHMWQLLLGGDMLLQDVRCSQPPKIQENPNTQKSWRTHRKHVSTFAHKLWKCASRDVNNGWRSSFVFKRRDNICEIWRLRKAHTQSLHVCGELSCN